MTSNLSPNDVAALLAKPSGDMRAEIAAKVARQVGESVLSPREKQIAQEILRVMVKDVEIRVREALATSLCHARDVPRDVALALAKDVEAVSIAFIEASPVLTDDDLIELVRSSSTRKQVAIARRPSVGETLSQALVDTGSSDVVRVLVRNNGAGLSETALDTILAQHGDDTEIAEGLVRREELPLSIAERLVTLVTDHLRQHLVEHHRVPKALADRLAVQSRERATADLLNQAKSAADVAGVVRQLRQSGRLTASLALRAACTGDMRFCEEAFSQIANLPVHKAWILLHDAGPLGLRAIYDRTGFPEVLYPAFRVALDVYHETELDGHDHDQERFERRMLERILTQYEGIAADDLEFMLERLGQFEDSHSHMPVAQAAGM